MCDVVLRRLGVGDLVGDGEDDWLLDEDDLDEERDELRDRVPDLVRDLVGVLMGDCSIEEFLLSGVLPLKFISFSSCVMLISALSCGCGMSWSFAQESMAITLRKEKQKV